jgi:hypothetical protein
MKHTRALLAIAGVAIVVAGCGGPLTTQEYLAAANQICDEVNEKTDTLGNPQTFEAIRDALAAEGPDVVSFARDQAGEFRELRPPKPLQVKHDTLAGQRADDVEAMEVAVSTARNLKDQADEGIAIDELDRAELESDLEDLEASQRASQETAREIGLEACAKP